jgi:hypothetical protein
VLTLPPTSDHEKLPQSSNKYKKILVRKNVFLILTCFVKSPDFAEYFKLPILFIFIVTLTSYSIFYLKVGRLCGAGIPPKVG